jgi:hypothetical protein
MTRIPSAVLPKSVLAVNRQKAAAIWCGNEKRRGTESFPQAKGRAIKGVHRACTETQQNRAWKPT